MKLNLKDRVKLFLKNKGYISSQSYSQSGEDLIVQFIFDHLKIYKPSYLDLGAHHPSYLNNTKLFYKRGSRGINIEPDPQLMKRFKYARQRDINLNIGVGPDGCRDTAEFYLMSNPTMNTFSKIDAYRLDKETSIKILSAVQIPITSVNSVLSMVNRDSFPEFLTVDIEGLDSIVIDSIKVYNIEQRPVVICLETIEYSEKSVPRKRSDLIESIEALGYFKYADTWINSIFVRWDIFEKSFT